MYFYNTLESYETIFRKTIRDLFVRSNCITRYFNGNHSIVKKEKTFYGKVGIQICIIRPIIIKHVYKHLKFKIAQ